MSDHKPDRRAGIYYDKQTKLVNEQRVLLNSPLVEASTWCGAVI
jgi:hypothetical protein